MRARGLRVRAEWRHRHQTADPDRAALDEGGQVVGRHSSLALLGGDVDLDQDFGLRSAVLAELAQDRVGGDRVDEAAERQHLLQLAALQVADEVPLEGVTPALLLGDEILLAVLADQGDAGLGQCSHLLQRHVLAGDEDLDPVGRPLAHPRQVGPHRVRIDAVDQLRHQASIQTRPPWRPVRPASRRWEKNSPGSQLVQSPAASTRSTPASSNSRRATSAGRACRPRATFRPIGRGAPGRRRRRGLRGRLRNSRGHAGADRGGGGADRLGALGDDAGGKAAPTAVQHRHAAGAGEGDREAVGGEDQWRQAGLADHVAVDLGDLTAGHSKRARSLRRGMEGELGAVDLEADRDPRRVEPQCRRQPFAVRDHGIVRVLSQDTEVELVERRLAHPTDPGRRTQPAPRPGRPPATAPPHSHATPCA